LENWGGEYYFCTLLVGFVVKLLTISISNLIFRSEGRVQKLYTGCAQVLNKGWVREKWFCPYISEKMEHVSVLKDDVYKYLDLKSGEVVIDATLGLGGHAQGIVELVGKDGKLIGFDQDERNLEEAGKRLNRYGNTVFIHDNFRYLKTRVQEKGFESVDAILFDLGISSPHVDEAGRGFSFMKEGPLDMRYSPEKQKLTADDVINSYSDQQLADVIYMYGEERMSRKISRKICERRMVRKFETTTELAEFIEAITPVKRGKAGRKSSHHPATKVFQALRIEVNDELNALKEALDGSIDLLKVGGRMVVISYHSLEDRIVKHFFKELARSCVCPKELLVCKCRGEPVLELLTKKPVVPSDEEIEQNPRARSAKLRAVKKINLTL
jgi:16S rRNA (cytosine1402-N4)-methyltransferase